MVMMDRRTLVVVGHGMVGHRLVATLVDRGATAEWDVVVLGEESRPAYDRVAMSTLFAGATPQDLSLVETGFFDGVGLTLHTGETAAAIDRQARTVTSSAGRVIPYDAVVLATGSVPFVPPLDGRESPGCFVYRTIDDVEAIRAYATGRKRGAVIGGGLLGLEAANALRSLGLETHVVEFAPRLMPVQLDEAGGAVLRGHIEALGVKVHTNARTRAVRTDPATGCADGLTFDGADDLDVDMVVFSAGIRPRDDLAAAAGLDRHTRGGVLVDEGCRTSDPDIFAIGECAVAVGRIWGLVSPGYQMARVAADRLLGGEASFVGADLSTKLKLLGVDVASIGDAQGATPESESIVFSDAVTGVYKKLVLGAPVAGRRPVIGAVLVGDATGYATIAQLAKGDITGPEHAWDLILPERAGAPAVGATSLVGSLAPAATVCSCNNVSRGAIAEAIASNGLTEVAQVKACTKAGTGCGACTAVVTELLHLELRAAGVDVRAHLCEHFAYSRQELFDIVRVREHRSFAALVAEHGSGRGCDICKPAVASMLASLGNGYILDGEQASLQDTNDHFLANIQKDGTYSVVPRVPGGEITPEQLIAIGQVAQDFGLYTKITGGQRIDLFGAQVHELPAIWARLAEVGMESGHAYGKALRTVKSCVGSTWCRYGVQDSTSLAIQLELRYRGLRAPHKIKCAVSGCARECAEAQGKDVGVIATDKGWNLWVGGNGGLRPAHAQLLAEDLDTETLMRYIDRVLIYYVRTADRLERTATWMAKLDGGLDHVRAVVVEDSLGLADELEAAMAHHVATYECEWQATMADPARMAHFRTFVNADVPDPNVVFVTDRGQPRPARASEKELLPR